MNKQQLANRIWASANKMRTKIEANEYKDYILGLIFYKFISDNEVNYLKKHDLWTDEDIPTLRDNPDDEDDRQVMEHLQQSIGYFISYDNLFSTWTKPDSSFTVATLNSALSDFNRLLDKRFAHIYENIFDSLQTGLKKLGADVSSQTKVVKELVRLIKEIPTDGSQGYDVLGFVYEYLISNFAASAGKKAGEFYTPHEVAILMSEIVAEHHKNKETLEIYDPTSGSGSLLITMGKSLSRHMTDTNHIKYYAQELIESTYNLTRMNLVMRGILPNNIITRNADSLSADWPIDNGGSVVKPLYVDAVVSNPPYSAHWDVADRESDARFKNYGVAPKTKADYAFLLHELHHLKPDGILTIVLPHGVLFRGNKEDGSEGQIRMNLIEKNNIDAIIGLPAGIFFGTGIPTLIMVLKQHRLNDDVLIIDASKGFVKDGKQNRLRACDIKRIADIYRDRTDVPGFSRKVSRDEIRHNDYNLNIPRYVDSSEAADKYDIYATMFGSIPNSEIDGLNNYWQHLTSLRSEIFEPAVDKPYSTIKVDNVKDAVMNSSDVRNFSNSYQSVFAGFEPFINSRLIGSLNHVNTINESREIESISADIFSRMHNFPIINVYDVYQVLADNWDVVASDIETFQQEYAVASNNNAAASPIEAVRTSCRAVDQAYKIRKDKDGNELEVPDGYKGRIMPFELIQKQYFAEELADIHRCEARLEAIASELDSLRESLSEDDADELLNDEKTEFDDSKVLKAYFEMFDNVHTPEIDAVRTYIALLDNKAKKNEKLEYMKSCSVVDWNSVEKAKDGTVSAKDAKILLISLCRQYIFPEGSLEQTIASVVRLTSEQKETKDSLKLMRNLIEEKTIDKIKNLTDDECLNMLHVKWITPIMTGINGVFDTTIETLCNAITVLAEKYAVGLKQINKQLTDSEGDLKKLIDELTGDEFAIRGLNEMIK